MKKLISLFIVLAMLFTFAACGSNDVADAEENEAQQTQSENSTYKTRTIPAQNSDSKFEITYDTTFFHTPGDDANYVFYSNSYDAAAVEKYEESEIPQEYNLIKEAGRFGIRLFFYDSTSAEDFYNNTLSSNQFKEQIVYSSLEEISINEKKYHYFTANFAETPQHLIYRYCLEEAEDCCIVYQVTTTNDDLFPYLCDMLIKELKLI